MIRFNLLNNWRGLAWAQWFVLVACFVLPLRADDIALKDGRVLVDAKIISQGGTSVTVKHNGGISSVLKSNLPEKLAALYPIDPKSIEDAKAQAASRAKLQETATNGDPSAQYAVGNLYFTGDGVPKKFSESIKWYRLAAEQGESHAQFKLARMYETGEGVPRDFREAVKWHRLAADQGNVDSLGKLAEFYKKGWGVSANENESAKYLILAAEHGNVASQKDLFIAYLTGEGVPISLVEALAWLNVIATGNEPDLKDLRSRIRIDNVFVMLRAEQRSGEILKTIADNKSKTHIPKSRIAPPEAASAKSNGTGVIVTTSGYVLTAAHVVGKAAKITVTTSQGSRAARVVKLDETNDLALLKIENGTYSALPVISSKEVRLGQSVATLGFPFVTVQGFSPKVTRGEISSINGPGDDPKKWQISAPVQPGNSGGPLLDECGNVIGIIVSALISEVTQNVNYAVKSSYALELIRPYLGNESPTPNTSGPPQKFEDMVAAVQPSVVLILTQ